MYTIYILGIYSNPSNLNVQFEWNSISQLHDEDDDGRRVGLVFDEFSSLCDDPNKLRMTSITAQELITLMISVINSGL